RDIPLAIRANGQDFGMIKGGADEDEPVTIDRTRHDGIAFSITHAPEFATVFGIISTYRGASRADDLFLSVDRDAQWSGEREFLGGLNVSRNFPSDLARFLLERDDKRVAGAIATEDERVVHHDRRTTAAMHGRVLETGIPPEHLAIHVEASRSLMPKMD